MKSSLLVLSVAIALVGCSRQVGSVSFVSQKYFVPDTVDWTKAERTFAKGSSTNIQFYIWDLQPRASIEEAVNSAIRSVNGDFITDVSIQETETSFILFGKRTLEVEGTVYKLPSR